jgi:ABC-type dipeptide/oligopeptide/nickel transport system permease subunit
MQAGVGSILLAIAIGVPIGLLAGYYRGPLDQAIMRLTDAWLSFPFLILAIGLVTILGPSLTNATLAIGLGATPTYIRLTRGLVLSTNQEDYVQAARALGARDRAILLRHLLPNLVGPIVVFATLSMAGNILLESALSFLGVGVRPPTPSWGNMIEEGMLFYNVAWWITLFPGLAILLTVVSFNLVGDGLRDALAPGLRERRAG